MALLSEDQLIDYLVNFVGQSAMPSDYLGPGDDAGWITVPHDECVVLSVDTLVEHVHFIPEISPYALGYRALAVSLSDVAAMGARPLSVLLAMTLPVAPEESWLTEFAQGFFALARQHDVVLLGGNVTRGGLSISTTVQGAVRSQQALRRSQVMPGDLLYVTGSLGGAGYALSCYQQKKVMPESIQKRWWMPEPRILAGLQLCGLSRAAMDISDGLGRDLPRLLKASGVGAEINREAIPIDPVVRQSCQSHAAWCHAVYGGEDYELLFSIVPALREKLEMRFADLDIPITCIGRAVVEPECVVISPDGQQAPWMSEGFVHF